MGVHGQNIQDPNILFCVERIIFKIRIICGILFDNFASSFDLSTHPIGKLFTKDPEVLKAFYAVFWVVLIMQPLCALAFIYDGIFKGLGKMKFLRNVLLFSTFIVFVPVLFILDYFDYKLYAIFAAFTFWIAARGIPLIVKFRKMFIPLIQKV